MIEAQIPRDIRKYESKFIMMFTLKQFICVIVASVIAVVLFNILKGPLGTQTASYVCCISAIPEILIGWFKFQGIDFDKFARAAFVENILARSTRVYEVKNPYRKALKPMKKLSDKEYKKTLKKRKKLAAQNPEYQPYA